jgi:type II secretory pathway component PulF
MAQGKWSQGKALKKRDLLMIVTQLTIMLRSGVDLADAVRSISLRSKNDQIRQVMGQVYSELENGHQLSQAMESQKQRFGGVMIASVAAGEAAGQLSEVLERLTQIINDEMRLHSSIRSAVSYPIVLMSVTLLVLAAMVFFVLPQFAGIYESSQMPTPALTQLMLDAAGFARGYWWAVLGTGAVLVVALTKLVRLPSGRKRIDRWMLRAPILRSFCVPLLSGRLFRLQGAMLTSGVSMVEVLALSRNSVGNSCLRELIDEVEHSVIAGEGIAAALLDQPIIPDEASDMIATAEANGQLGSVLQTVGEFYEGQGEQKLRDAVKIAEPAIIVAMGLIIGAIVLSVMLPLLNLSTAAGM